jgi:hypothetical protein
MHRLTNSTSPIFAAIILSAAASGACNRQPEKMTTAAESQAQSAKPTNMPMTVAGCVKAGEAPDTFVLTTARAEGAPTDAATYELVGDQIAGLRDHIGRRAEISGTVQAQQEIASSSTAKPADERATGTSGTPTVQTRAEIEIKRLSVASVKPLDEKCD